MNVRITPMALAGLAVLAFGPSAAARAGGLHPGSSPRAVALPGDASASSLRADPATWIVGARAGSPAAARAARAHGATHIAGGAWLAPRGRARALAAALRARGLLDYAEPNRLSTRAQGPTADQDNGWRAFVVGPAVAPPVLPTSPLIALVDSPLDPTHPEFAGSNIATAGGGQLFDFHGTATAAVAAGPANGVATLGVWPNARALNVPVPQQIRCSDSARQIAAAVRLGAAVINMSYGSRRRCGAEEDEILRAVRAGAVPVAASGNEARSGDPLEFPAGYAHVLTVGAIGEDGAPSDFSSTSTAVDLSAPGVGILTAVPFSFVKDLDPDQPKGDGIAYVSGTSFATPMVSAAVAWIRAARPDLTPYQAGQVVRLGARDTHTPGFDNATGFGILSLPGALGRQPPAEDPAEPNDDIRFVDGRSFGEAAPAFYDGSPVAVTATADASEDPVDVYRVRLRSGERVRIALRPTTGDPDLYVFGARAGAVGETRRLRARSRRTGRRTDRVAVRNRGRGTRTAYVAVGFTRGKKLRLLNAAYTLTVKR